VKHTKHKFTKNMKRHTLKLAGLALAISITSPLSIFAQGSLTPPGAPAPTMKTLAQIEPRTPISSLPYTITNPGSYYLTTNLTKVGGTGNGISFSCGDITLDLNGFYLQGVSNGGSGIYVTGSYTNLVVRHGSIIGWGGSGIDSYSAAYPRGMLFEKLMITGNGVSGILTEAGSVVRDCVCLNNGLHAFPQSGARSATALAVAIQSSAFPLLTRRSASVVVNTTATAASRWKTAGCSIAPWNITPARAYSANTTGTTKSGAAG
jgi:hypothetical protein